MKISECKTVEQWQQHAPWPTPKDWLDRLSEIISQRTAEAHAKLTSFGLPEPCKAWAREYRGPNERGNHIWDSAIRTGGDDIHVFHRRAQTDCARGLRWQYIERWSSGYRSCLICPAHRLTLTYCEGDITLVWCVDRHSFSAELRDAHLFYQKH